METAAARHVRLRKDTSAQLPNMVNNALKNVVGALISVITSGTTEIKLMAMDVVLVAQLRKVISVQVVIANITTRVLRHAEMENLSQNSENNAMIIQNFLTMGNFFFFYFHRC